MIGAGKTLQSDFSGNTPRWVKCQQADRAEGRGGTSGSGKSLAQ